MSDTVKRAARAAILAASVLTPLLAQALYDVDDSVTGLPAVMGFDATDRAVSAAPTRIERAPDTTVARVDPSHDTPADAVDDAVARERAYQRYFDRHFLAYPVHGTAPLPFFHLE